MRWTQEAQQESRSNDHPEQALQQSPIQPTELEAVPAHMPTSSIGVTGQARCSSLPAPQPPQAQSHMREDSWHSRLASSSSWASDRSLDRDTSILLSGDARVYEDRRPFDSRPPSLQSTLPQWQPPYPQSQYQESQFQNEYPHEQQQFSDPYQQYPSPRFDQNMPQYTPSYNPYSQAAPRTVTQGGNAISGQTTVGNGRVVQGLNLSSGKDINFTF